MHFYLKDFYVETWQTNLFLTLKSRTTFYCLISPHEFYRFLQVQSYILALSFILQWMTKKVEIPKRDLLLPFHFIQNKLPDFVWMHLICIWNVHCAMKWSIWEKIQRTYISLKWQNILQQSYFTPMHIFEIPILFQCS